MATKDRTIIEEIKRKTSLVAVMDKFGGADLHGDGDKREGWHKAHESKSKRSLHVDNAVGVWHCKSCGEGGDLFDWVGHVRYNSTWNNKDATMFGAVLREVAAFAGVEIPEYDAEKAAERRSIEDIYQIATEFFHGKLTDAHRDYLHKRGYTDETINRYKLGYAPAGGTALLSYLVNVHKIDGDEIVKSGLFLKRDNGSIQDHFQGRLMFPYLVNGRTVYYIGRITNESPKWEHDKGMKYKKLRVANDDNPYVSDVVNNRYFYGEDSAKPGGDLLITEGVADCLSALQAGFACVSPVTIRFAKKDHAKILELAERAGTVYICNDNEESNAGGDGTLATAHMLWERGKVAKLVTLPRPADVDKVDLSDYLATHTADDFRTLMGAAKTLLDLKVDEYAKAETDEAKIAIQRAAVDLVAHVKDKLLLELWKQKLPSQIGLSVAAFAEMLGTAGATDAPAVATLDDVLSAIEGIANSADLKPTDRQKMIVRSLSTAIGDIDKSFHVEIVAALEQANAGFTQTSAREFIRGCAADAKKRQKEAQRQRAEQARENLLAVRTRKGKVSIDVGGRQLSDVVDEALQVLAKSNNDDPRIFVRNGVLARVARDERGYYGIQEFDDRAMLHELSAIADWETVIIDVNGNPQSKPVDPPLNAIRSIFGRPAWPEFPALSGIVNAPVFSREGVLHDHPGYNPATRLYYTGGVKVGDTTPTPENIARAKDLIFNNLLVDFPFKDEASRAHAVAYLLLPFVRDMIDGPTPVHDVDSPTAGTGKGKLLNACAFPFLGHDVPTMAAARDDEEWRKRITTSLLNGSTHLVIDNVNHELDSGSLASAFTQPVWEDRALGSNREVKIPIRTIWGVTANNIKMSQELARRCVWMRLDANVEKPWERTEFKHKNLIGWAKSNRDALVTAALTFVRSWVEQGTPIYSKRVKGSYESWAGVLGGILETVGIPGFLENETELYERVVSKTDMMSDFVEEWWKKQQELEGIRQAEIAASGTSKTETCLSSYELFKLASYADDEDKAKALGESWCNLLGDMLSSQKQRGRQTQLGRILETHLEKVVAGYKITLAKTANGSKFWQLQPTSAEPQTGVLPGSTSALPPVAAGADDTLVEPMEPYPPISRVGIKKNSCLVNGAVNGKEKNNSLYTAPGAQGSIGSTDNGKNNGATGGRSLVEPQTGSTEVPPGLGECPDLGSPVDENEVFTWEL